MIVGKSASHQLRNCPGNSAEWKKEPELFTAKCISVLVMKYIIAAVLLTSTAAFGQQGGEQEAVLSALTTYFRGPVSVKPLRYQFTPDYTVEPVFSPDGALARLCVESKDYASPYLSESQYDELFRLLNSVKSLGMHKEDLGVWFTHGGRSWTQQQYEHAYVSMGERVARPGREREIAAVCVYYLRPVTGLVAFRPSATPSPFGLICIDNQAYIAPVEEQEKLRHSDERQTVTVAGPTGDDCRNVAGPDR